MTTRTTSKTLIFERPFVLGGFDEELPAGAYCVETDEELLEGISFPAYRRTLARIHLHAKASNPGRTQTLTIDPNELDAAIERDRAPKDDPDCRNDGQETLPESRISSLGEADRLAISRGEDEGMIVRQG